MLRLIGDPLHSLTKLKIHASDGKSQAEASNDFSETMCVFGQSAAVAAAAAHL